MKKIRLYKGYEILIISDRKVNKEFIYIDGEGDDRLLTILDEERKLDWLLILKILFLTAILIAFSVLVFKLMPSKQNPILRDNLIFLGVFLALSVVYYFTIAKFDMKVIATAISNYNSTRSILMRRNKKQISLDLITYEAISKQYSIRSLGSNK